MRTLKRSECAILHLVLKKKWFDMIESGEKREEYRDDSSHWACRLRKWAWGGRRGLPVVVFQLGYAHEAPRMAFLLAAFSLPGWEHGARHPEWGEPETPHYIIGLGERVELED